MNLDIETDGWPDGDWEELSKQACTAIAAIEPVLASRRLHTSLWFTTDSEIHKLNRQWRQRDKPTNVLSFPMLEHQELVELEKKGPPVFLGDIALAHETCANEAKDKAIPLDHHAAHLIIHGLLHLAGHDHVENDRQAEEMESLEIAALARMGIANPYGDHQI